MANVAHKDLTGVDLHEPKGVAGQTAGKVYISDGAGSGVWTLLDIPTGLFRVTTTTFTSSGTWTKPADLFMVRVTVLGGGGTSTTTTPGPAGGTSSFSSHCSATGGQAASSTIGGVGGVGSGGNINLTGGAGTTVSFADHLFAPGGRGAGPFGGSYGQGQNVFVGSTGPGNVGTGGGGGCAIKYILSGSLNATEAVTISTSGMNNGLVVVEEFILV